MAGGGGTSAGGFYTLNGTVGQHDAGAPMFGGAYALTGGFWALLALQTPGAPMLYISKSAGTVSINWQNTSGWILQQNASLAAPANWSASSGVTTLNGTNYFNLSSPSGSLYFRLKFQ